MSATGANAAQRKGRHRNYYCMLPDLVVIRVPFPMRTLRTMLKLASQTGLTGAEITTILIGPEPQLRLRDIVKARDEALADRRGLVEKDPKEERK